MKKVILFSLVGSFLLAGTVSESYKVKGMHCQYACASKVKSLMNELDGMEKCDIDFEASLMTVEYDNTKVNPDLIVSILTEKTTFETRKIEKPKDKKSFWSRLKGLFG